jgi:HD-like signal output (HDOD) protein
LGATHAEVGAALLALWGLSDDIVEAVAFHHEPDFGGRSTFSPLAAVHAANLLVEEQRSVPASSYLERIECFGNLEVWRQLAVPSAA